MKVLSVDHQHTESWKQYFSNIAAKSICHFTSFRRGSARISHNFLLLSLLFAIGIGIIVIYSVRRSDDCFPAEVQKYLQDGSEEWEEAGAESAAGAMDGSKVLVVQNLASHGPVTARTPLLVVLVRGGGRLRALLAALAQVPGVDDLLLVLSYARSLPAAERLARSVDFCMLVQVYYPHAASAVGGDAAERTLHWWWTAHLVYESLLTELVAGRAHDHLVVFLDDGCVVLPDLAHTMSLAHFAWAAYFPDVGAVSLGGPPVGAADGIAFTLEAWRPPLADGLGLRRDTWRRVVALRRHYCSRAAPDWSAALAHVFAHFPAGRALVLAWREARVLRGAAGTLCARARRARLYPSRVRALAVLDARGDVLATKPPVLGWSAPSHLALCINISNTFITERRKRPKIFFPANNTDPSLITVPYY